MATRYTTRATGQHATAVQFCLTLRKPLQSFQGDGSMGSPHAGHSLLPIILNPMEASHRKAYGITSYLDIITSSITHQSSSLLTSLGVPSVHPSIRPSIRSTNGNKEIPFSIQISLFFFYRIDSARSADSNHNSTSIICMYGNVPYIKFL